MWVSGVVAAIFLLGFATAQPSGCRVFPNRHLGRNSRLLLVPNSSALDGYRFLLPPAGQKFFSLQEGQQLILACPSLGNRAAVVFRARCVTGTVVQMLKPPINRTISKLPCRREPRPVLRVVGRCAKGTLPLLGAGFLLGKRQLVRILDVCHDSRRVNTLWVRFTLMQGVEDARQKNVPRAPFLCTRHFGNLSRSFDKLYDPSFQHSHFQKILGSAEDAGRYINESMDMYLVRGMLASHHDFIYYAQQKVSSFCVNTAPMWHNISIGEWRQLGASLRRFASRQGTDLTVYSGAYGQLRFAESNQVIRLGQIIVPAMFWKLVYDRLTFRGIVFIVDNRVPHLEEQGPPVCLDVCRQVASSWFDNIPSLNSSGRVHCCSVYEFLDSTRVLPEFHDTVYNLLV